MPVSPGQVLFRYLYETAPIVLTGGIASQMPGGAISIVSLTQPNNYSSVLAAASGGLPETFAPVFIPMPGATLIDEEIGSYPFANQMTAANAIITKPLMLSYRMICPAVGSAGFLVRQAIMTALQKTINQHNLLGGLYTLATPIFVWLDCVMLSMRDISPDVSEDSTQAQIIWQLDFVQPLVTLAEAQQAQNALLSKIGSGTQLQPNGQGYVNASGAAASVGNPSSGQAPAVSPAVQSPGQGFSGNTLGNMASAT